MISKARARLAVLFGELKRRHVFRVAITYLLVGWGVIQVVTQTFPFLQIPEWTVTFVIVLTMLGFPVAVTLAWAFELTPEGILRTESVPVSSTAAGPGALPAAQKSAAVRVTQVFPRLVTRPSQRAARAAERRDIATLESPEPLPPDPRRERRASLATMRHELRTPLNAILGYSEMLLEEGDISIPGELAARLRTVRETGRSLLAKIDEVLKPEAHQEDLADSAETRARVKEALGGRVEALLHEGQWLTAQAAAAGDSEWTLDVRHISDAAIRLDALLRELTGLTSASAPSVGATALFGQARAVTERMIARARPGPRASDLVPPRHAHLLVVDDNALNRDLFSRQLTRQGFSVSTAANGREALEQLRAHDFDLILLDVLMPGLDGVQVLDIMQQDAILAEVPVIMISALDEIDGVVRCIEKGAADYLTKPFDPTLLQARIGAILEIRRLREQQRWSTERAREMEEWSARLVSSLLPPALAARVDRGQSQPVEVYPEVTVLAVDLEGMDTVALRAGPEQLREELASAVGRLERIAAGQPVERLWVGGRTLLLVAGVATPGEGHAEIVAELALRLTEELAGRCGALRVGMGMHTGTAVAGAVGTEHLVCGLWGDAVSVAEGLARTNQSDWAQISSAAYARLYESFTFESQGVVETGGRGQMRVYRLTGSRAASPT